MYLPNWLVLADMGRSICKIYLSQFWIVFVYIVKCIWLVGQQVFVVNLKIYLFKHWNVFVHIEKCIWPNWLVLADMGGSVWANVSSGSLVLLRRIAFVVFFFFKYICLTTEMYLCTMKNVFCPIDWFLQTWVDQFAKCICLNFELYLCVHIVKCIWPNWLVGQNIFFHSSNVFV